MKMPQLKLARLGAAIWVTIVLALPVVDVARAAVIDFGPLVGANDSPYLGHNEDGFSIAPTGGNWFQGQQFGLPSPSIFGGPAFDPNPGQITVTGGLFTFASVDLSSNSAAGTNYIIDGLLDGNGVFSFSGEIDSINTFITILGVSSATVDELRISLTPVTGVSSFNLDNIVLNAVPVPAALPLLLSGLGVFGFVSRKRRCVRR